MLVPSIVPLQDGLDLQAPKLIARPGTMMDCLNYEIIDRLGYSRIDGFSRYDGNISLTDLPSTQVYRASTVWSAGGAATYDDSFILNAADNQKVGYAFAATSSVANTGSVTYIMFDGRTSLSGCTIGGRTVSGPPSPNGTVTQTQLIAFEAKLRALVVAPPYTPVGLHWFRNELIGVIPMLMIHYKASAVNTVVAYIINDTLTTTYSAATALLLDKVITTASGVATAEEGYFIIQNLNSGSWDSAADATYNLGGAISVSSGTVYHQTVNLSGMTSTACSVWSAERPYIFEVIKILKTVGWVEAARTFQLTVTLSGITTAFNSIANGNTDAESTYYFESSPGNSVGAVVVDYQIISGSFAAGTAVVNVTVVTPILNAGAHDQDITTSDDMYGEAATTTKLGDVTTRMALNYLPGYPQLKTTSSRYLFKSINFFANADRDAVYGVNGCGRAFRLSQGYYLSFLQTQADSTLDIPRHVENHRLHLALGFQSGSVILSVVGEPNNFNGVDGASEIACGDRITGLLELAGNTLGIFCEESIWCITGATVDDFVLEVIAPNTGCIEYTLADCGIPVYLDSRGISTLETSNRYGNFVGTRMSSPVSSWLIPRCKKGTTGTNNFSGIACAVPVRTKNQYRIFFNDGNILTMSFTEGSDSKSAFTLQKYHTSWTSELVSTTELIPFAWTSEVDQGGTERIYMAHYNESSTFTSAQVYALDCGNSFDGTYIFHFFEMNWYFGEAPIFYRGLQKIRMHGLSKGYTKMVVQAAGIDTDYGFGQGALQTTTEPLNLPRTPGNIYNELLPVTNIANLANRGLGVQLKFKGSNTDSTKPEPGHICQVLVVYSREGGAPDA